MALAEKAYTDFRQVPLNVLAGEPRAKDHRERHPFGKVPVLDHDGMRILETAAIARYLNDVLPGKPLIPATPRDRARMDMVVGVVDSYGYRALVGGVAAYHLFPDFVGGKSDALRASGMENGRKAIEFAIQAKCKPGRGRAGGQSAGRQPRHARLSNEPAVAGRRRRSRRRHFDRNGRRNG